MTEFPAASGDESLRAGGDESLPAAGDAAQSPSHWSGRAEVLVAVLAFAADAVFTEREKTARLETWVRDVSQIKNIDGVTVRRYLIDAGYLTRSKDGTQYRVARPGPQPPFYDESIDSVDVLEVIENARAEIERRKQAYLKKTQE